MANRYTRQFVSALEADVTSVFARVTFGSAGAATLVKSTGTPATNPSKGVISITHDGTGLYTFLFGSVGSYNMLDIYNKLLGLNVIFVVGTTTIPAAPIMSVADNKAGTLGSSYIQIQLFAAGGSAADPASGESGRFEFKFSNSSAS